MRPSFFVPHVLLLAHRNAERPRSDSLLPHALGVIGALDVCAVSNICSSSFGGRSCRGCLRPARMASRRRYRRAVVAASARVGCDDGVVVL